MDKDVLLHYTESLKSKVFEKALQSVASDISVFSGDGTEHDPLEIIAPFVTGLPTGEQSFTVRDSPWSIMSFMDRSLAANVYGVLTPVVKSGSNVISGNRITIPASGLYLITITGGTLLAVGNNATIIAKNEDAVITEPIFAFDTVISSPMLARISTLAVLQSGDYLTVHLYSKSAQSTIQYYGREVTMGLYLLHRILNI